MRTLGARATLSSTPERNHPMVATATASELRKTAAVGSTLSLSNLSVPAGYSVIDPLVSSLAPGASDNFIVQLDTAVAGTKSGNITFTSSSASWVA